MFCMKCVIVACSYLIFNSGSVHTCQEREKATKTALILNISLGRHWIWMKEAMKMCKMLFPVTKHCSAQDLFSSFSLLNVMKPVWQYVAVWTNALWNVQILMKPKEYNNSFNKAQALTCVKLFSGWSDFRKKLGFLGGLSLHLNHLIQSCMEIS